MLEALAQSALLTLMMAVGGIGHLIWMRSPWSEPFNVPIDGGAAWQGRPVLGANKTWRGLMAMPVVCAAVFWAVGALRYEIPGLSALIWPVSTFELAVTGAGAGLAFMLAELPNSFLKRRLGVAPGQAPASPLTRAACAVLDRFDSLAGLLVFLALTVGISLAFTLWTLVLAPMVHLLFSYAMFRLGLKNRAL